MAEFLGNDVFLYLKVVFILANTADPGEMPPNSTFHLGLHCLSKYLFISLQNEEGYLEKVSRMKRAI